MGEIRSRHRPLLAGIGIKGSDGSYGTLTGLATRNSDGEPVLVTNLHVVGGASRWTVSGNECIYQWDVNDADKVGQLYTESGPDGSRNSWVPVVTGLRSLLQKNIADVAALKLSDCVGAEFALHNHPIHDNRQVTPGVIEPRVDMKLTMLGATSGERTVTVRETDQTRPVWGTWFTGLTILRGSRLLDPPSQGGDSGAPCLSQDDAGCYRMCCIAFGEWNVSPLGLNIGEGFAFPASVAERELGITFGYPYEITTRSEENMGIPVLTSEGFSGRRVIIDDYFQAGETLYAGDVVAIQQASIDRGSHPRIFRIAGDADVRRVIGVVHTPAGKEVGDQMATTGATPADDEYVSIVVQGLAKVLSDRAIQVGDPLTPSDNAWYPNGKNTQVARVGLAATNYDAFIGRCLSATSGPNQVADILVDVAGGYDSAIAMEPPRTAFNVPTNLQVVATSTPGELSVTWNAPSGFDSDRDYYEYQYRENDYEDSEWHPDPEARSYTTGVRISELPGIEHQVQVRAVYNGPNGDLEGRSSWVTATGTPRAATLTPSNDATLSALGITPSSVTLVPAFTGATESYTASAGNALPAYR